MAHVGAGDHFNTVARDIVNTAFAPGLNKELGTSLLASAETLKGVEAAASRLLFLCSWPASTPARSEVCELLG